jgi:hypothetical protein
MAKANKRPVRRRSKLVIRIGTCSNCRAKETQVVQVKNAQVCTSRCLGGVSYPEEPVKEVA